MTQGSKPRLLRLCCIDVPLRFSLYPVPVSQCHLIGTEKHVHVDRRNDDIEVSISISRSVPVANTKLYRLSSHIATSEN